MSTYGAIRNRELHARNDDDVLGVTLRLLVINISSSYPAINELRRWLPAISVTRQLFTAR